MRSGGQQQALDDLSAIASASCGGLVIAKIGDEGNTILVDLSIDCTRFRRAEGGLPLRRRERIVVAVPPQFPFNKAWAFTRHRRFEGFPHVNWSIHLCLYQAPDVEWVPSAGMFGFIHRLHEWLTQAALGELDPTGAPLHPPATFDQDSSHFVIPRVDTPNPTDAHWFGFANLSPISATRVDLTGWTTTLKEVVGPVGGAVLLSAPMPYQFPSTAAMLVRELMERGVDRLSLIVVLMLAARHNGWDSPLHVVIGTPMRGIAGGVRKQHLTAWYIPTSCGDALRLALEQLHHNEEIRALGQRAEEIFWDWIAEARVNWCVVREDRPEILVRRDDGTPVSYFRGRVVSLWGCGGLGSHLGDQLVRAGVKRLILHDSRRVAPGVLVRQQFVDSDITLPKADALARRLRAIRPDVIIDVNLGDLLTTTLDSDDPSEGADAVIDTTGSIAVVEKLESRWPIASSRAVYVSMVVGPAAERGFAVVVPATHTGGVADVLRQAKLGVCVGTRLRPYLDEFWPVRGGERMFQPEPGCSEPTFVGSGADIAQLAGALLNQTARALARPEQDASAHFITRADLVFRPASVTLTIPRDRVFDLPGGYRVRLAHSAWMEIQATISESRRRHGRRVETGGLLFGERNAAARVLWISEAIGPPPDSSASASGFLCGVAGAADLNAEKRSRTRGSVAHVGMWHTHPDMSPAPSETDLEGMVRIVSAISPPTPEALLVIVGGDGLAAPQISVCDFTRRQLHG